MNAREKFLKIASFELTDKLMLPREWQWFWITTIERWKNEGLPADVHLSQFFGFERMEMFPLLLGEHTALLPPYEWQILKQTEDYRIVITEEGIKRKEFIPRTPGEEKTPRSMSQWLEFPIKNSTDWQKFKKRLNPASPARYPEYWEDKKNYWKNRNYPLGLKVGSFYGWLRDWVGLVNLSLMFYDNVSLVHEMMEYLEYFIIETIRKAVEEIKFDFAHFWEDMAFKTGPLISPTMFKEFLLPHYKKITSYLRGKGVDIITVDSDGNINELIPLWLEADVNGFLPLEVAADMDAIAIRKKYGKNTLLIGNIDKRALIKGKEAIKHEVESKVPYLLSQGGYLPTIDHAVPPDVPFENYMYYLHLLRKIDVNR
ncbi:MAG: hypothetical protein JSV89_21995 [Spirochaetaceae bacterium]|nr:MAG: hypothetical protein JSV89_21995 [Spirochaetaceae bacterium]